MKKKIYNSKLLLLFVLLFGVSLRPHVAQAAEPDSYVRGELNKYYRNYTNYYEVDGYVYYESYAAHANRATHYENGMGRWNAAKPTQTLNSLHSPGDVDGRRMLGQAQDWGFRGHNTVWDGPLTYTANGVAANRNVRYTRKVKVTYRRDKTTPVTEGISNPSSNIYVNGNNWWVKTNDQFQLTVQGYQNYNGFGKRLPLRDYISSNYLSIVGEGQEVRSQMYRDGGLNTFRTTSHFKVSRNTSSLTATDRRFNSRYNLTATQSGKKYDISTYAGSQNGKTHGYVDTGIDLRTDGVAPDDLGAKVFDARYVNGNDHWIRPGDKIVVEAQGYDKDSRMKQSNVRLFSSGHDNRGRHFWTLGQGTDQYQRTGDTTTITGGKVDFWSWTTRYHFNVSVNSNAGNRTINIETLHGDNVGYGTGWTRSDQRIRTDATAPTITANTSSRGWGNGNQSVTLTHADGQSGIATKQYAWSTSTATPSSWTNYSSAVTQSSNGTWYLHARAVDNVGRVTTQRFGPYRIDKSAPNGTITQSPTGWTNGNVTLTFNATDSGGSGVRRVRQSGGSWVNGSTTSRTVSSNGTYSFEVEDNAGNTRTVSTTVDNIDRGRQDIRVTASHDSVTNQNVTLAIEARDYGPGLGGNSAKNISGLRQLTVRRPDGTTWTHTYPASTENLVGMVSAPSFTATQNGDYQITTIDRAGNSHTITRNVPIDRSAPTTGVSQTPTAWTKGNVTVTWTANAQGLSDLRRVRFDDGSGWSSWVSTSGRTQSFNRTVTGNRTVQFQAEDVAGNVTTRSHLVSNIDKAAPNGSITGNPTSWQNTNATLTFKATDTGGSGVKRVRIAGGTWVNGSTTTQTASANGTYSFEVEDNAGNTRTVSASVNRIDKTLPNGTITGNPTSWQNTNATLTFKATDTGGSGVRRVRIAGGTWVNGSTTTQAATANGSYSFEVEDNAGNKRTVSVTVNRIDKSAPSGTITGNPTSWQNTNATLTFKATDTGGSGVKRVRIAGGTWVNGSTTTQTATANGTYSFEVEDNAGNKRTVSASVTRIDKALPNGTISGNPTSWQNTNATLTFNATDTGGSGVRRVRVAGGTWVNGSKTTQTATANGTYSFEVEDNAGNKRTVSVTVNRIDKVVPNGTITGNPTSWQNTNATLTFNATDSGGSGVKRVRKPDGTWVNGSTTSQSVATNGSYTFRVEDNAGNIRDVSVTVTRIDKAAPNGTISGNPTSWQNTNATLTFNATDTGGSGVKRVRIAGGSWVNGSTTTQTATANGTYSFEVEDNAGNKRTVSVTVNRIDKTLPNGSITGNPTSWQNTNATLTFNATDSGGSGVRRVRIAGGTWVNGTTTSQTATANGTYSFEVEDNAGNKRTVSATVNRIDKVLPNGTITGNPTSWQNTNATLTFNATDSGGSGVRRVRIAGGTWVNGSTTTQTATANGTYSFEVEDNAGNKRTVSVTVNRIDKSRPTASSTQSPTAWTNGDVTITWNASATGSPLKRIRTHNGSTWGAWSAVSGTTSSTVQTVTSNGTYRFQVEDQAGNVEEISRTVSNIDKTLPNASSSQSPTGWTNGNVTITWSATAAGGSPLQRVRTHNGSAWGSWTTISGTTRTQTQVVSSNGTYHFQVQDAAGNVRQISRTVSNIDKGSPAIRSSQSPTAWTNGNVTLTLEARDFGEQNGQSTHISGIASIQVKRPNGTTWNDTYGGASENSPSYYGRTFTATENGTYTVTVTDRAGNTATHNHTVSNIDRVLPTGSTTRQTGWTKGDVWIDVTGRDVAAGLASIKYVSGGNVTGTTSYSFSGTTASQKVRFTATTNGTYTFDITDRAGNVRRVTQEVANIDRVLPNMTFTSLYTDWTNTTIDMRTTVNDRGDTGETRHISGVQQIRMRPQGGSWSAWRTFSSTSERSSANLTETWTIPESGTYEWQLQDRAGNIRTGTQSVTNIDYSIPTGSANHMSDWTNGNVWIDVTGRDTTSGLASIKYVSGGAITGDTSFTFSGTTASQKVRFIATTNGTYSFDVTDRAGNTRRVTRTVSNIDRTMPSATTAQNPTGWTNQDVTISLSGQDLNSQGSRISGVDRVRMRPVGASSWTETRTVSDSTETSPNFNTLNFTVSANDRYQFELRDRAGNIRIVEHTVSNIDRTAPHGATTQTPTAWTNEDIVIRLTGGDTNNQGTRISGVNRVRMRPVGASSWSETRTISDSTESSPTFNPLSFTITENGRYQFELRDRAGNIRMVEHTVTNIDRLPPETSGSFVPDGWTNQTITITWLAERTGDPGAPLEAYRYDRGNGNWTNWQNATHADAFTVAQQVTENGVYRFDIRDEAGNVARSSVTVSQHDIVLPTGDITARFDRSERDDHVDYTSNDLVNMVDSNRVTVDVTGVEDLGISGVDFVTIEEQRRIGYGGEWMTVGTTDYDWPHPYNTSSQTYAIDVSHAQDTRFILTVTDRAGNTSSRATSNVVRHSVLQAIDFRITDVVNPQLTEDDLDAIRASDLSEGVVELTAGTNVTFDVTYYLRHLDTVDQLSGKITIETISDDRIHTHEIEVKEDETGHNQHVTFTKTFTVPQGTPKGSEITIVGNLVAEMANGTTHEISYPSTADLGVIDSHIEEFFRFRIVR